MAWTAERLLMLIGTHCRGECVTEERLAALSGYTAKQVENACQNLLRHGFVKRSGKGCHRLTPAGQQAILDGATLRSGPRGRQPGVRPRDRGLRQRAWNVLRTGKKNTIDDIVMLAGEGLERDPRSNLRKYLRILQRAGVAMPMPRREAPLNPTSNGAQRWWLVRDLGPLAPVHRPGRNSLHDPNAECDIALAAESPA